MVMLALSVIVIKLISCRYQQYGVAEKCRKANNLTYGKTIGVCAYYTYLTTYRQTSSTYHAQGRLAVTDGKLTRYKITVRLG